MFKSVISPRTKNLLFLHGWGTNRQSLFPLIGLLKDRYNIFAPDLPWPDLTPLSLDDYVRFVLDLITREKISRPVIIGHSLGGAIATKIAATNPRSLSGLVLLSAASIRHPLPQPWQTLQRLTAPLKPLLHPVRKLALKLARLDASDYLQLTTPAEKTTFRRLISADLTPLLSSVNCPTLILWGETDPSTPLSDARTLNRLIKNSRLHTFPGSGHFFYLDHPAEVAAEITAFIRHET